MCMRNPNTKNIRLVVLITKEDRRKLKEQAKRLNISMAQLVRDKLEPPNKVPVANIQISA